MVELADLFDGTPNLANRSSLRHEAAAAMGKTSDVDLSAVAVLIVKKERLYMRWKTLNPRSENAIRINQKIRMITEKLLKIERQNRNGSI